MVVLFRGLFTDLGLQSFGRLWPFYVSYTDFGFARRMLLGTLLQASQLDHLVDDEYVLGYIVHGVTLTMAYAFMVWVMLRRSAILENVWLQLAVFFSPAFLVHFAHTTGALDLFVVLVFMAALFATERLWAVACLIVVGSLTHELFLFLVPTLIALKAMRRARFGQSGPVPTAAVLIAVASGAAVLVSALGKLAVSELEFERVMAQRLPIASADHQLWSGFFEIAVDAAGSGLNPASVWDGLVGMFEWNLIPTVYALFAALVLAWSIRGSWLVRVGLIICTLFPFLTILVAGDFYRWASLAGVMPLMGMVYLSGQSLAVIPKTPLMVLTAFGVFAPFGGADRSLPFPLIAAVVERAQR